MCAHAQSFRCVQISVTPGTVAYQAPLPMGFSRQEYWSGLSCPPPGDLSDPGVKPKSPVSPALQVDSSPSEPLGKTEPGQFLVNDVWGPLNLEIIGKIAVLENQVCVCVCVCVCVKRRTPKLNQGSVTTRGQGHVPLSLHHILRNFKDRALRAIS